MAEYDASSITVLKGLEAVRRRPGMYVGDTEDGSGLHNMLWSALETGFASRDGTAATYIQVRIDGDWISVTDDGCGLPINYHRQTGKSALEVILTTLFAGGCWDASRDGLHGVGLAVVNGLSAELNVEVRRAGRRYRQSYRCGTPTGPVRDAGPTRERGTTVSFVPDATIFGATTWDRELITGHLRELAWLNPQLTLICDHAAFRSPHGLSDGVRYLAREQHGLLPQPLHWVGGDAAAGVDVALQLLNDGGGQLGSFVNKQRSRSGTHVDGVFDGLFEGLSLMEPRRLENVYPAAFRECLSERLVGIVHVELPDARFGCSFRYELTSPEAGDVVKNLVADALSRDRELCRRLLSWLPGQRMNP